MAVHLPQVELYLHRIAVPESRHDLGDGVLRQYIV